MTGFYVTSLVVTVIALARAWGYPSDRALDEWNQHHGLRNESPARTRIAGYLRRTRWIRTLGFLAGWNLPVVWLLITGSTRSMTELGTTWWVPGFALGIVVAELTAPRYDQGRSATLEPRQLSDYLPGFTRVDGWIIAGIVALLAALGMALPSGDVRPIEPAEIRGSVGWYLMLCAVAALIMGGTRLMQQAIVRRRQSFDSVDETQADDALRSASIQGLAGVGYGGPLWIAAVMAWDIALSTGDPLSGGFDVAAPILAIAGFGMLVGFPRLNSRWVVRRAREA